MDNNQIQNNSQVPNTQPMNSAINNGLTQSQPTMYEQPVQSQPMYEQPVQPQMQNNGFNQGYNQVPNNQPIYNNPIQDQPLYGAPTPKKSNVPFIVTVVILSLIILGLILYLLFGNKLKGNSNVINNNDNVNTQEIDNGGSSVAQSSTITLEGYEISMPQGYVVETIEGHQFIVNKQDKIIIDPKVGKYVTYTDFLSHAGDLKNELESTDSSIKITSYSEKTYGGKQWLIYNYTVETMPAQIGITSFDTNHVFIADTYNPGTTSEEQIYTALNTMITNAQNKGGTSLAGETQKGEVKIGKTIIKPVTSAFN